MNCHTARAALDWLNRLHELPVEFDAVSVSKHLQTCAECAALARQRQRFDLTVGQAMRDVAIPSGLRERLMLRLVPNGDSAAALTRQDDVSFDKAHNRVIHPKSDETLVQRPLVPATNRFVARRVVLTACSVLLVAGAIWFLIPRTLPRLSLESLHAQLMPLIGGRTDQDVPFVAFENGQFAKKPQNQMRTESLGEPRAVTLYTPEGVGAHGESRRAAAYFFQTTSQKRPIPVMLVVVPRDALELLSVPSETSFLQSEPIPLTTGVFVSVWTEGELVYLCYIRGTKDDLRRLQDRSGSA